MFKSQNGHVANFTGFLSTWDSFSLHLRTQLEKFKKNVSNKLPTKYY